MLKLCHISVSKESRESLWDSFSPVTSLHSIAEFIPANKNFGWAIVLNHFMCYTFGPFDIQYVNSIFSFIIICHISWQPFLLIINDYIFMHWTQYEDIFVWFWLIVSKLYCSHMWTVCLTVGRLYALRNFSADTVQSPKKCLYYFHLIFFS